jgi:2,4-dienoyl-CoA reductase-like NADH-dependent reductase (Old Yellow Enzyme family)/thioredoxin reductase
MNEKNSFSKLLKPGKIGNVQLKNRWVMSSMGTRLPGVWGEITEACLEWYVKRAEGGVGLVTVEATHVAANLFPVRGVVRMPRADDDCFNPGLYALAEAVHNAGAKISIQLSCGRAAANGSLWDPGESDLRPFPGLAPSSIPFPGSMQPRAMTIDEIQKTTQMFGKAAARVKRVGFDVIELHTHSHSILGCFMSPLFNQRDDEYGGSFENRLRFTLEVIHSIKQQVGDRFPLMVKYSIDERVDGGRDLEEGLKIAKLLQEHGVDAIVVSQGQAGSPHVPYAPLYWPKGFNVPLAEALKKTVSIPIVVGGRLGDPVVAEQVLACEKADFIGLGRPLIADPELPQKVSQGKTSTIRVCLADNYCFENFGTSEMRCTLNFAAGQERKYAELKPTDKPKKVFIIGAGAAGMEAARVAGLRGHQVYLYEKESSVGNGELLLAAAPPHKEIFGAVPRYYAEIFKDIPNLKILLGKQPTAEDILEQRPDAVLIATGGKPLKPNIPGINSHNVTTAFEVLAGRINIEHKNVVVCGGNAVGCETSDFLARKGNRVTLVEMIDRIGPDIEPVSLSAILEDLKQGQVNILTGTKVIAFTEAGVQVTDKTGTPTLLKADITVLALGVCPDNQLSVELEGKVPELYVVGDAKKTGKIHHAIADAYLVAMKL